MSQTIETKQNPEDKNYSPKSPIKEKSFEEVSDETEFSDSSESSSSNNLTKASVKQNTDDIDDIHSGTKQFGKIDFYYLQN